MRKTRNDLTVELTKSVRDQMLAYAAKDKVLSKYQENPNVIACIMIEMLMESRKPIPKTFGVRCLAKDTRSIEEVSE